MRLVTTIGVGIAIAAFATGPALADAGAPGATFPEQAGTNPETACAALVSNSSTLGAPRSATALAITNALFVDACFGG